jgi:hypothetical protein
MKYKNKRQMSSKVNRNLSFFINTAEMPNWVNGITKLDNESLEEEILLFNWTISSQCFRFFCLIFCSTVSCVFLYLTITFWPTPNHRLDFIGISFFICFTLWGLIATIHVAINPAKRIILNRMEGTLTMPASGLTGLNWKQKTLTIPFKDAHFEVYERIVRASYTIDVFSPDSHWWMSGVQPAFSYRNSSPKSVFSLVVWFMDKNRPLPPGKIFDPYRKEDYRRRKEEGFPEPLFQSSVDTPEWEGADADDTGKETRYLNIMPVFNPRDRHNRKVKKRKAKKHT